MMKKRLIHFLGYVLLLVAPVQLQAQINYQYWFDNNNGSAVTGSTTDGAAVPLSIDASTLSPGLHFYNIRARQGTKWGTIYRYLFWIPREQQEVDHTISGYEYWIDNNKNAAVKGNTTDGAAIPLSIDVSSLSPGLHFYNIRARQGTEWGCTYRYLFSIPREPQETARKIKGYRYGFNGEGLSTVTFNTPVSEYNLQHQFDVPSPQIPTTIDDDCHFSFNGNEATLTRDVEMTFELAFIDELGAMSAFESTTLSVEDVRVSDITTLPVSGSQEIPQHSTGGYSVFAFTITAGDRYNLKSSASSCLRLYSSDGTLLTSIDSETLAAGYTQSFEPGTYYAVAFENATNAQLALTHFIGIKDNLCRNICINTFDPNQDGELSEQEAAAVNSLGLLFQYQVDVTSFDELQYFTGLTSINANAFDGCLNLASVTLPNNLTSIGDYAFYACRQLTSIVIPDNVTTIGEAAFAGCLKLASVSLPNNLSTISVSVFSGCALKTVDIPNGVTEIGDEAFSGCSALESVSIPASVTSIGSRVFDTCEILTTVNIAEGSQLESIGSAAFYFCRKLESLVIPDGVSEIEENTFAGCNALESVTIPNGVTSIGRNAFGSCFALTSISIPNSVTTIGESAFAGCSGLVSLIIPNGVTTIGKDAFHWCEGLTSVTISNTVTSIGESAFGGCSSLTSVTLYSIEIPTLNSYAIQTSYYLKINVFNDRLEAFKAAPVWSSYAYYIYPISLNTTEKWSSYYNGMSDVTVPEGTTIYKVKLNNDHSSITLEEVTGTNNVVAKDNAVLLKAAVSEDPILLSSGNVAATSYTNDNLLGSDEKVTQEDGYTYYALANKSEGLGFYKVGKSVKIPANKAYLRVPVAPASAPAYYGFGGKIETNINDINLSIDEIDLSGDWYTVDGQKLNGKPSAKGLYIVNGHKVIIK